MRADRVSELIASRMQHDADPTRLHSAQSNPFPRALPPHWSKYTIEISSSSSGKKSLLVQVVVARAHGRKP